MPRPQQDELRPLNPRDLVMIRNLHEPEPFTVRVEQVGEDDEIIGIYEYRALPCKHSTLRAHVDGGYICATDSHPECHEMFTALPGKPETKYMKLAPIEWEKSKQPAERQPFPEGENEDVDGDKMLTEVAQLLAEFAGWNWETSRDLTGDMKNSFRREADEVIDLVNKLQGTQ